MPKPRHPVIAALLLVACGSDPSGTAPPTRSYHMGFSAFPPRPDTALVLPTLTLATQHSDAGLVQLSIPWQVLLDGISAAEEVRTVRLPLANYYRAVGQPITVALDVTDGLNRAQESPELIAAGRSITEPPVRELYRRYVNAVDTILRPEYLSLAAETNLIRLAAPAPVYSAIVAMAGAAAGDLRARGTSSVTVGPVVSSPELQSRYIRRHAAILDRTDAAAVFQITFTDLDLAASPPPPGSILPLFAHLGLVDSALGPKPALAVWDSLLAPDRRE